MQRNPFSFPTAARLWLTVMISLGLPSVLPAQNPAPSGEPPAIIDFDGDDNTGAAASVRAAGKRGLAASWETQKNARTLNLVIPAPRGIITDRYGRPLSQNRMGYYPALNLPLEAGLPDGSILQFAHFRIQRVNTLLGASWTIDDEDILRHYKNRRWVPLTFGEILNDKSVEILRGEKLDGFTLRGVYLRDYPRGAFAPHIIGYVQRSGGPPTGPIQSGDHLFEEYKGVIGLEAAFEDELKGKPGRLNILFNNKGEKISEEIFVRPTQGNTVVTTIDADMQALAERILRSNAKRGALVVTDVQTGEILAMASLPLYDPNEFVPAISQEKLDELMNDPGRPFFPRAFKGTYPPASTFKVAVAVAALKQGAIDPKTGIRPDETFACPGSIRYGRISFPNWHSGSEERMTVRKALARSCNTWFYQVGQRVGSGPIISQALAFGYGRPTGIPLQESSGFLATNAWMQEKYGRSMSSGHIANLSIGQGFTASTPLQVAQMMGGIGNKQVIPRVHLIRQIQDTDNRVIKGFSPAPLGSLNIQPKHLELIYKGMTDVVHASYGTGKRGYVSGVKMAAKTGTGQWITQKKQNVAWFAGFLPANRPRFAFAALYEGRPGQGLSGGSQAAPIVSRFFRELYGNKKASIWTDGRTAHDDDKENEESASEEEETTKNSARKKPRKRRGKTQNKKPVRPQPVAPAPKPKPQKKTLWGSIKRIFGR